MTYSPDGRWYWNGAVWCPVWAPPPAWKGARLGRPASGPGSLASPARRLAARLLDGLLTFGLFVVLAGIALLVLAPHYGPMFPPSNPNPDASEPTPGFLWLYVTLIGVGAITWAASIAYETIATVRYGRTLGKAWMGIRPLRTDGGPLNYGRALARIAVYAGSSLLSWVGLLDPLWCVWDGDSQCVHDKIVETIVVND